MFGMIYEYLENTDISENVVKLRAVDDNTMFFLLICWS